MKLLNEEHEKRLRRFLFSTGRFSLPNQPALFSTPSAGSRSVVCCLVVFDREERRKASLAFTNTMYQLNKYNISINWYNTRRFLIRAIYKTALLFFVLLTKRSLDNQNN